MTGALLIELLVKSSLIAAAGLALSAALAFRPASDRVDILRAAICLLIALPALAVFGPSLALAILPAAAEGPAEAAVSWSGAVGPVAGVSLQGSIPAPSPLALVLGLLGAVWVAGALWIVGRFAVGVWTLGRWTREGQAVADPAWTGALARVAERRRPRLVSSPAVAGPLSWGLPPGVVLIGRDCLARPESARAVLAHELAHLRRRDWLFLALSRLALALFWFNPLVWLLHAELAARSEDAADAAALATVDRRTYARTLVGLAAGLHPPSALAMAGPAQSLTKRIARIMKTPRSLPPRPLAMTLAIGALVIAATPLAALELTQDPPPPPPAAPEAPPAPATPLAYAWLAEAPPAPPAPPTPPTAFAPLAPPAPPRAPHAPTPPAPPAPGHAYAYGHGQDAAEARRMMEEARARAAEAREHAAEARVAAQAHRAVAVQARVHAEAARAAAAPARAQAAEARALAAHAMADARVQMAHGADEMDRGAEEMRKAAQRLRDPAYRAEQIAEARARGETVTDAQLIATAERLPGQADDLQRQAVRLRAQAAEQP